MTMIRGFLVFALACAVTVQMEQDHDSLVVVDSFDKRQRSANKNLLVTAEDIRKRVARAGGNADGVLVASLSWSTADDLDLHVKTPSGAEVYYRNKKAAGGELDVDMCVHGRHSGKCTDNPVENVVFSDEAKQGRYDVFVQNFAYHPNVRSKELQASHVLQGTRPSRENHELRFGKDRHVPFEVLVKIEGTHRVFSGLCTAPGKTREQSNVRVFSFEYFPNALTDEGRVVPIFESSSDAACVAFRQKLLDSSDSHTRERIEGKSRASHDVSDSSLGTGSSRSPRRPKAPASQSTKKSKRAKALEHARERALATVRANTRETLLAKTPKILRELITDLGTTCRGCLDKAEIVDRLFEVAGVQGREEL